MSGILTPGQASFGIEHHANMPNAYPAQVVLGTPAGQQLHVFGGLSKRQMLAGMVVAGFVTTVREWKSQSHEEVVARAIEIADDILASTEPTEDSRTEETALVPE
jgi:hypothetical protein